MKTRKLGYLLISILLLAAMALTACNGAPSPAEPTPTLADEAAAVEPAVPATPQPEATAAPPDDGAADDGIADDGVADDGIADDGAADDSVADDGAADDSIADDGAADSAPSVDTSGWQLYRDAAYGFELAMPEDWSSKVMGSGGGGMPDDWPVVSFVVLLPPDVAEAMARGGSPDPNAPPVVPPVQIEVCVGDEAAFRRAFYDGGIVSETGATAAGLPYVLERDDSDDFSVLRYVFTDPADGEVRVVVSDMITGFSSRAEAYPELPDLIRAIVSSVQFVK